MIAFTDAEERQVLDLDDPDQLAEALMLGAIGAGDASTDQLVGLGRAFCELVSQLRGARNDAQVHALENEHLTRELGVQKLIVRQFRALIAVGRVHEPVVQPEQPPSPEAVQLLLAATHVLVAGDPGATFTLLLSALGSACLRADAPVEAFDGAVEAMQDARAELVRRTGEPSAKPSAEALPS